MCCCSRKQNMKNELCPEGPRNQNTENSEEKDSKLPEAKRSESIPSSNSIDSHSEEKTGQNRSNSETLSAVDSSNGEKQNSKRKKNKNKRKEPSVPQVNEVEEEAKIKDSDEAKFRCPAETDFEESWSENGSCVLIVTDQSKEHESTGELSSEETPMILKQRLYELKQKLSALGETQACSTFDCENLEDLLSAQREELAFLKNERKTLFDSINQHKQVEDDLLSIKIEKESWLKELKAKEFKWTTQAEALHKTIEVNIRTIESLETEKTQLQTELQDFQNRTKDPISFLPTIINEQTLNAMEKTALFALDDKLQESVILVRNAKTQKERKETEIAFCCVCLEGEKTILVMPCKHLCLCEPCSKQKKLKLCPVCRTKIQQKINVFV